MNYYYDQQIMKYLVQFMSIFSGMIVKTGKAGEDCTQTAITVPIQYGSKDRVAAAILTQNTQNKPLRLPVMSAYLRSIQLAPERRKGIGIERRVPYVPLGGLVPDDIKVVHQLTPVPYNTQVDLTIFTSNQDTHFQILEQIFILFDPIVQIQTSDAFFDMAKITMVELKGITPEEQFPSGANRRMSITTLNFSMPIYLSAPVKVRKDAITDIYLRVGAVTGNLTNDSIRAEFEQRGITYDLLVSADDLLDNDGIE